MPVLEVHCANLLAFAGMVSVLDVDHDRVVEPYGDNRVRVDGDENGVYFADFAGAADVIEARVNEELSALGTVLNTLAVELFKTEKYYRYVDSEEAARVDALYGTPALAGAKPVPATGPPETWAPEIKLDPHPMYALGDPEPLVVDRDIVQWIVDNTGWFSLSYWADQALQAATGWSLSSLFEQISRRISGDWLAVSRAGQALVSLGDYHESLRVLLDSETEKLVEWHWKGLAADAFREYETELSGCLTGLKEEYWEIGKKYSKVTLAMYHAAQVISDLLDSLIDTLVELTGAALLAATGVGAPIAAVAGARTIFRAVSLVNDLITYVRGISEVENVIALLSADSSLGPTDIDKYALPGNYDNEVVPDDLSVP